MEELTLDMIIEAQLGALEQQCMALRMILALKRATEVQAEVPQGPIPRDGEGFVMPPTFRGSKD